MTGRDIALTGVPRGGTTLACQLLGSCDNTVALFEPMDVPLVPVDVGAALDRVDAFYYEMRERLTNDGTGISKHRGGVVPDNPFDQNDGSGMLRRDRTERGVIKVGRQRADFVLVIKHNAMFAGLLPDLARRKSTLAIVRNPLAVLASWNTVNLPIADGRLPAGERLDSGLRLHLQNTPDRIERQCSVLDWFFARFRCHLAPPQVLRYEEIVSSHGGRLREAAGLTAPPRRDLKTRNASAIYGTSDISQLVDGLMRACASGRASWTDWYSASDVQTLAHRLLAGTTP